MYERKLQTIFALPLQGVGQDSGVGGHESDPLELSAEYESEEEVRKVSEATSVAGKSVSWPQVSHWKITTL